MLTHFKLAMTSTFNHEASKISIAAVLDYISTEYLDLPDGAYSYMTHKGLDNPLDMFTAARLSKALADRLGSGRIDAMPYIGPALNPECQKEFGYTSGIIWMGLKEAFVMAQPIPEGRLVITLTTEPDDGINYSTLLGFLPPDKNSIIAYYAFTVEEI